MVYAVLETGGKQYRVQEGDVVFIEKIDAEEGTLVEFDKIVAVSGENGITLGAPYVEGAQISALVMRKAKAKKIIVYKYKAKKNYHKKKGHRQDYTKIQIESIKA